jgi:hypothetical protein
MCGPQIASGNVGDDPACIAVPTNQSVLNVIHEWADKTRCLSLKLTQHGCNVRDLRQIQHAIGLLLIFEAVDAPHDGTPSAFAGPESAFASCFLSSPLNSRSVLKSRCRSSWRRSASHCSNCARSTESERSRRGSTMTAQTSFRGGLQIAPATRVPAI